ncbi:hypothetical protein HD554DRAFT_2039630 [Boletus coccyginus]|nr:hypothetical protein HD554DRAFT_2039630 [Boletus coccyginus]
MTGVVMEIRAEGRDGWSDIFEGWYCAKNLDDLNEDICIKAKDKPIVKRWYSISNMVTRVQVSSRLSCFLTSRNCSFCAHQSITMNKRWKSTSADQAKVKEPKFIKANSKYTHITMLIKETHQGKLIEQVDMTPAQALSTIMLERTLDKEAKVTHEQFAVQIESWIGIGDVG